MTLDEARHLRPGDPVSLGVGNFSARPGVVGVVGPRRLFESYGRQYLDVVWTRPQDGLNGQKDGGYRPDTLSRRSPR